MVWAGMRVINELSHGGGPLSLWTFLDEASLRDEEIVVVPLLR